MKKERRRKPASRLALRKLAALENAASARGIQIHYDRLEAAGLRLKSGLCTVNGEHHLYVEKRKSIADKIDLIKQTLDEIISSN